MTVLLMLLAAPIPKADTVGTLAIIKNTPTPNELIVVRTDGKQIARFPLKGLDSRLFGIRLSPDRQRVLIAKRGEMKDGINVNNVIRPPVDLFVVAIDRPNDPPKKVFSMVFGASWSWSGGDEWLVTDIDPIKANAMKPGDTVPKRTYRVDVGTGRKTDTEWATNHDLVDLSADGKTVLASEIDQPNQHGHLLDAKSGRVMATSENGFVPYRLSADGQRAVGFSTREGKLQIAMMDWKTKSTKKIGDLEDQKERSLTMNVVLFGPHVVAAWKKKYEPNDPDKAFRFCIGTIDHKAVDRKVYFTTDANETIGGFDLR